MEAYSSSSSSSSSSACMKATTNSSNYQSSLHSVRKSPLKTMKKPIAPLPPTRPKVYKVDPMNFRDLVQKLTGAANDEYECSSLQPQRLKSVAPPPINVSGRTSFCGGDQDHAPLQQLLPSPAKTPFSALYKDLMNEMSDEKSHNKLSDCATATAMASNSFGLSLSPSSYNWCSYPLLSPGSLSQLGV